MVQETIGHYRVLEELGSGGMGVVYRAEDLKLGRMVALKFLADGIAEDAETHERFLREARAAAALNHPNVCTIYEIADGTRGRAFIAMELLEGQTLQRSLETGPIPDGMLLDIGIQVADALEAAHRKGLVHRDIKPGNIFLTLDGRAKVVDFGLAKPDAHLILNSNQGDIETGMNPNVAVTRPGTTLGTVAYMSPEQARAEQIDNRSDLFSFGLVLYEMATGRRAFDGQSAAVVFDGILNRMPPAPSSINPALSRDLERVIGHAIEKSAAARYQRASEIAADLRRLRRASDPEILAVAEAFGAPGLAAGSPAWAAAPDEATAVRRTRRRSRAMALSALALLGVFAAASWWHLGRAHPIAEGAPILVTDFTNRTSDADFDGTLKQALTIKLQESPYLAVVSQQKVREALTLMTRSPDDVVTASLGREMCPRVGAAAVMSGEIARLGSAYVMTLAAESCATGEEIAREQVEATRKEDVLGALGRAAATMRGRLGESLASIRKLDTSLPAATTSSLPALKSFSLGDARRAAGVDVESIPFYRRAIELDPQFALAYARLGTVLGNTGEDEQAKRYFRKAYELRDRASEHERFYITAHYYTSVEADLPRAREVYELWRQTYPHDYVPVHNLGTLYLEDGDVDDALQAFRDASAMEPRIRLIRDTIAETLIAKGQYEQARWTAERQLKELGFAPQPHLALYLLDYLLDDKGGMAVHAQALRGTSFDFARRATDLQIAVFEGRFAEAGAMLDSLVDEADSQGRTEYAEGGLASYALDRAVAGFASDARARATRLLAAKPSDANTATLAFALLLAGDPVRARTISAPIWPRLRDNPSMARILKPAFEALVAVREGRPQQAIELLTPAEGWEGRMKSGPVSSDVRGLAYLALGNGRAAEAQFRKRLAQRGVDPLSVSLVVDHLAIGRARLLAGDKQGARKEYEEFFSLWKNADANIPFLQQARTEYARLN